MIFLKFSAMVLFGLHCAQASSENLPPALSTSTVVPTIITLASTVHDYTRFADGGPDANWYIGFNNAWIVKLPPSPVGEFQHAFIGAKIGRTKTRPYPEKPWRREIVPGKIYIGISQAPAWTSEQSFFLTGTSDIPTEADPRSRVDGIGAAEWFWAEIPLSMVSFTSPNYLVVWSPSNDFVNVSSSPILAAAELDEADSQEAFAWNNHSILGVPPRSASVALETPINNIAPALAIKLVPPEPDGAVSVNDLALARSGNHMIVRFSAAGEDIDDAWVETSRDQLDWERVSKLARRPPYVFDLSATKAPPPGFYVRGVARDISGAVGRSEPTMVPYAQKP